MLRFFSALQLFLAFFLFTPAAAPALTGAVAIDPGHGGWDSGAVGPSGFAEKTANLDIGLRVRDLLAKNGYRVVMTRTTDISPNTPPRDLTGDGRINISDDLQARVNLANAAKAKAFVSIHNNAGSSAARGTETYYWSGAPANSDSARLAGYIQAEVKAEIGLFNRGVKSANFYVLRRTDMSAALLEGAFISNPTEEMLLKTPEFRQRVAKGVFNGIRRFIGPAGPEPEVLNIKLKPNAFRTVNLNNYFWQKGVGERIASDRPILVERVFSFNTGSVSGVSSATGAHKARRKWYFAEGFTGQGFETWLLLVNPARRGVTAKIEFVSDQGLTKRMSVKIPPFRRRSVYVNRVLPGTSFGVKVTSPRSIVVERSMYYNSGGRSGGHVTVGAAKAAPTWYFADGSTKDGFDTWLLLLNPGDAPAQAQVTYLTSAGESITDALVLPANSRRSLRVMDKVPNAEVSTFIAASANIVAERTIYSTAGGATSAFGAPRRLHEWYFTKINTSAGRSEVLKLQNLNAAAAPVTIDYSLGGGRVLNRQTIVPARSMQTVNIGDSQQVGIVKKASVRLNAPVPITAEKVGDSYNQQYQGISSVQGLNKPAKRWFFAEGFTGTGFSTSLLLFNPNDSATNLKVRFYK